MKRTQAQISYNMSRIRGKGSSIEKLLMHELWSRGLRYRKNVKGIPGSPDIVYFHPKVAVFCDGEFWHGYDWELRKDKIKSNKEFWFRKIERNMQRDREVNRKLAQDGWIILRFWENDIRKYLKECADTVELVVKYLHEEPEERNYWP